MEPLHARYPFLDAAREAVSDADADLAAIAGEAGHPVVERALDRVRSAIDEGTVGEPHRTPRVELLSYPVARVLVSLVDEPGLTRRYAVAEAATARERFEADIEGGSDLRSVGGGGITLGTLLGEFDLAAVERDDGFAVDVAPYLRLAAELDAERWRLVNRVLADGRVAVTREELYRLLAAAIRERVEEGLPLDVPEAVAEPLAPAVSDLRERLAELEVGWDIDRVDPDLFPPCVAGLLERADDGGALPPHSRFALVSFLATIGMDGDAIADRLATHPDLDAESVRSQVARLRDEEASVYPSPSCAVTQAYGDCAYENRDLDDWLCERVSHPLEYYERRLRGEAPADYASRPESQ